MSIDTGSPAGLGRPPRFKRRLGVAAVALVWERLWPAMWPACSLSVFPDPRII